MAAYRFRARVYGNKQRHCVFEQLTRCQNRPLRDPGNMYASIRVADTRAATRVLCVHAGMKGRACFGTIIKMNGPAD